MRRNGRGILDYVKENHYFHKANKEELESVKSIALEIKDDVKNSMFQIKMEEANITEFFPAQDNDSISRFMENNTTFNLRRRGFYNLLKTIANSGSKKKFSESLLTTLFSLDYKRQKKWPCIKKDVVGNEYVPKNFIAFLKASLTRVSYIIKDVYIDLEFWESLPSIPFLQILWKGNFDQNK